MRNLILAAIVVCPMLFLVGCPPPVKPPTQEPIAAPEYDRPLPEGQLALRKLTAERDIPDFTPAGSNLHGLELAIGRSLDYLSKPSSQRFFPYGEITHAQAVASLQEFNRIVAGNPSPAQLNQMIREKFDVYISVGWDNKGTVLFTGYYTPIFDASPTRTEKFRYPIYKLPADLVKNPDGTTQGRRDASGQITKYPDRKGIESSNMLAGSEMYWLADPFEVYIVHVQGSAILRMPDNRQVTVGYAANNGYDYKSVGKELIVDKKLASNELSLRGMITYFKKNPQDVQTYTWRNPRFVFFAESADKMPRGSLNEPVFYLRTIATDKSIFPRACVTFITTELPRKLANGIEAMPYKGFAMDQDTGGAIRAPGRCDVYMGTGDEAGEVAGRTQEEGKLYYLFLKPTAMTPPALPPAAPAKK